MKKSNFIALISGAVGVLFFGIGMCMSMIPEWNLFRQGIAAGGIGLVIMLAAVFVYRRMEHKVPIRITPKTVLSVLMGIAGALGLGGGMCLTMVFGKVLFGMVVGVLGIALLFCLIPLCKGVH